MPSACKIVRKNGTVVSEGDPEEIAKRVEMSQRIDFSAYEESTPVDYYDYLEVCLDVLGKSVDKSVVESLAHTLDDCLAKQSNENVEDCVTEYVVENLDESVDESIVESLITRVCELVEEYEEESDE